MASFDFGNAASLASRTLQFTRDGETLSVVFTPSINPQKLMVRTQITGVDQKPRYVKGCCVSWEECATLLATITVTCEQGGWVRHNPGQDSPTFPA